MRTPYRIAALATLGGSLAFPAGAGGAETCAGFEAKDAATLLGAPAGQVARKETRVSPNLVLCSYSAAGRAPGLAFSVETHASAKAAAAALEKYRDDLELAAGTPPWRGKLPKGAWSDIMGLADEAVWTDINGSLTVRHATANLQFTLPGDKAGQLRAAQAVLRRR